MTYQILAFGILLLTSAIGFTGFYLIERLVLKNGGRVDEGAVGKYSAVTNGINCIITIPLAVPVFYGTFLWFGMLFDPRNTNASFAMYAAAPFATILCSVLLFALIRKLTNKLLAPLPGLGWKGILGSAVLTTIASYVIYFVALMIGPVILMIFLAPGTQQ